MRRTIPGGSWTRKLPHIALYRKYRSQTFDQLVGQDHITKTIKSAIESGRISHAYLFTGPRGTGKTSTARILAKCLNCEMGPTTMPCGVCSLCGAIASGSGGDVLELDAASESGVDEVRDIIESAKYTPMQGRYKIFVIDEVHDLSSKAFDALLKTIEEPPKHVVFILATTEFNKVPLTIRSRCQCYDFHRGTMRDLVSQLELVCQQERIEYETGALAAIARMADGGYRDALSLLEQAMLVSDGGLSYDTVMRQLGLIDEQQTDTILEAALEGDTKAIIDAASEAIRQGKEPRSILESLLLRLSDLTYSIYQANAEQSLDPVRQAANHALASRIGSENLLRYRAVLAEAHKEIRDVTLPRLWLELALLKLINPERKTHAAKVEEPAAQPARANPSTKTNGHANQDIEEAWRRTVEHLLSREKKSTGKMLENTRFVRVDGKSVVVGFQHQMQLDRVKSSANGQAFIQETFAKIGGYTEYKLQYELCSQPQPVEYATVETPVEGEELAKMVEDIFDVKAE